MSGGMYIPVSSGSPNFRRAYNLFKSTNGSIVTYSLGYIKKGNDYLFPALDYEKDICMYKMGSNFTDPASCPKFSMNSNGRPLAAQYMSYTSTPTDWPWNAADIPYIPSWSSERFFISHTYRYTSKIQARDYETYDSSLHRRAGVTGGLAPVDLLGQAYSELPHGSVFYFDIANNWLPTSVLLVATFNMSIVGYAYRHSNVSYSSTPYWGYVRDGDYSKYSSGDLSTISVPNTIMRLGYTYYCRPPSDGSAVGLYYYYVYEIPHITIVIDGNPHRLVLIMIDSLYSASGTLNWKTFESPMLQVKREDTSMAASCYILDEAITIHKPGNGT